MGRPLTRTLAPGAAVAKYPRRDGVRVDTVFARELGISEARGHRALYEHPRLVDMVRAAVVAYRETGDLLGLTRLKAAVEAGDMVAERLTGALFVAAQEADAAEEVAETAYLAQPSRATAEAFVRALDKQQMTAATLRAALVERWAL